MTRDPREIGGDPRLLSVQNMQRSVAKLRRLPSMRATDAAALHQTCLGRDERTSARVYKAVIG